MKAVVLEKGKIRLKDIRNPFPLENEVLVKVLKAGICNTDLELVKGYMEFEGVLGHEFVGQVVQTPKKSWLDRRVVGEINLSCGECDLCRRGLTRHCLRREVLGIQNKNGAFAEFLTLPLKNLHLLPSNISDAEGVFIEPLAAALEILEQIPLGRKDSVLVLGDGKLGLLAAQVMKLQTEKVHCRGRHERKLEILKKRNIQTSLSGEKLEQKFDVVVEATGKEKGIEEALLWVNPRGRVILKSTFKQKVNVDISKIVVDEIQLIGSRCGPFHKAIDVLKKKSVDVEALVDADFPLDRVEEAFVMAQKPEVIKVLLTPE
jgi:threonine dehydrogenase-like Zn-dependent dehydrogenase